MELAQEILLIALYFVCPVLILLILLQGGSGDLSSSFGGGGQLDSALGVGAMRKIGKITAALVIFFLACVVVVAIPSGVVNIDEFADPAAAVVAPEVDISEATSTPASEAETAAPAEASNTTDAPAAEVTVDANDSSNTSDVNAEKAAVEVKPENAE